MRAYVLMVVGAMTSGGCGVLVAPGVDADDGVSEPDDGSAGEDDDADGSSSDGDPEEGLTAPFLARSGERIKSRVLTTPDGAKQWSAWHDMALGVDCYFARAGDGATRCVPTGAGTHVVPGSEIYFADDACSVPLSPFPLECDVDLTSYVVMNEVFDSCPYQVQVRVFDGATEHTGSIYRYIGATCTLTTEQTYIFAALGPEIPPSTFQQATGSME
jgi:hypothetical protein